MPSTASVFECKQMTRTYDRERLWIAYHRSCQSWCLFCKKVRGFYRTAWSSHFGQSRNDTGNIISCHAPSILVLVQIPNSTRPKWTHACPKILTRRLLSDVHCFRLRRVSVSLLDFTPAPWWFPAENTLRASLDMGSTLTSTSIYEIDDQDIISNSMLPQHSNRMLVDLFYHFQESSILICLRY